MNLTEARKILKNNGYKILTEDSSDEATVYLYLSKPNKSNDKTWFDTNGQEASDVGLYLNSDYFKGLLSKLGVSDKFFTELDKLDWDAIKETYEYEGDVYAFGLHAGPLQRSGVRSGVRGCRPCRCRVSGIRNRSSA